MITSASRLALLAAVVWVARLAVRTPAKPRAMQKHALATPAASPQATMTMGAGDSGTPFRYIDLRRGPEHAAQPAQAAPATVDPLRQRLLSYLEKRETERMPS